MKAERDLLSIEAATQVIVFIYESMDRSGGIQSIVFRQIEIAKKFNKHVFVICKYSTPLKDVPSKVRLDFQKSSEDLLKEIEIRVPHQKLNLDIIAFSPEAAPIGFLLQTEALKKRHVIRASLSLTILHPRDLMRETEKRHVHLMNKFVAHAIGLQNLVFMNEQCRITHSAFLSRDLSSNKIVPVPIDEREPRWMNRTNDGPVRIICVGRIVNFKAYNFALPSILAKFAEEGRSVSCDIFGYGSDEAKLTDLIKQYGVSDVLKFRGSIPLEKFDDLVSDYDLFIGMGTAALQAAQLGVPTILAIVDDEHGAHGFIDSAPFGNLGENDPSTPRRDLKKLIEAYLNASPQERMKISLDGIRYANRYVTDDYVEQLTQSSVSREGVARRLAVIYCHFYLWMARDNWLRKAVRLLKAQSTPRKPL